jgi:hypothetical protein
MFLIPTKKKCSTEVFWNSSNHLPVIQKNIWNWITKEAVIDSATRLSLRGNIFYQIHQFFQHNPDFLYGLQVIIRVREDDDDRLARIDFKMIPSIFKRRKQQQQQE